MGLEEIGYSYLIYFLLIPKMDLPYRYSVRDYKYCLETHFEFGFPDESLVGDSPRVYLLGTTFSGHGSSLHYIDQTKQVNLFTGF